MLARCTNNGTIHHSQETLSLLRAQIHKTIQTKNSWKMFSVILYQNMFHRTSRMDIKSRPPNIVLSNHLHNLETAILLCILLTSIK